MPTRSIGTWENGTVDIQLDYDAQNIITAIRCINGSPDSVYVQAVQLDSQGNRDLGRIYETTFPPNAITVLTPPTGQARRLSQYVDSRGFFNGLDINVVIPAPA
jgi:hypothetical protein